MKFKTNISNMRKYYQVALAVTAIVSLISLLFYRHEYNKLRYVLEVFNYFGKPEQRGANVNCTNFNRIARFNARFDKPIPSWQRLEDDLYVYSVYNINNKEIRAIGLGTVNSVFNIQCLVFFESDSKPILGSFKFIPTASTVTSNRGEILRYGGYHFVCSYTSNESPVGITFVTKSNKYLNYAPIFPIKIQPQNVNHKGIGVCVMQSSMKPMQSIDMISFISFHASVGMDNFIIYDSGLPSEFNNRLNNMTNNEASFWNLTYTVIPWNFPFMDIDPNIMKEIIETDCLYRTYNSVTYAITLSWNEYVVLRYHYAIINLMDDLKGSRMVADRYKLETKVFCTQQDDNKRYVNSTLMVLKKTKSNPTVLGDRPIYIHKPHVILKNSYIYTKEIEKDLVAVNQYKYCDSSKGNKEIEDTTILRFAENIQKSLLFQRYLRLYGMSNIDRKYQF